MDESDFIKTSKLTVAGKFLALKNADGQIIDSLTYSVSLYNDDDKKSGGFSMERIDPENTCYQQNNWKASQNLSGGTPGEKNSVYNLMGYYMHAFKLSVYYLYKISNGQISHNNLYYNIMSEICNLGGDTDTNCAIVGTMIGPLIGYKNFHPQSFDKFINIFPENRTQYTSAFMYIYVKYLEDKYLNKKNSSTAHPSYDKLMQFLTNPI